LRWATEGASTTVSRVAPSGMIEVTGVNFPIVMGVDGQV
jgi:hypothetical protein